jgi:hypothetical protein
VNVGLSESHAVHEPIYQEFTKTQHKDLAEVDKLRELLADTESRQRAAVQAVKKISKERAVSSATPAQRASMRGSSRTQPVTNTSAAAESVVEPDDQEQIEEDSDDTDTVDDAVEDTDEIALHRTAVQHVRQQLEDKEELIHKAWTRQVPELEGVCMPELLRVQAVQFGDLVGILNNSSEQFGVDPATGALLDESKLARRVFENVQDSDAMSYVCYGRYLVVLRYSAATA